MLFLPDLKYHFSSLYECVRRKVPIAPIRVANEPNTTSKGSHARRILLMIHPIQSPGMAAGVNAARMVSASENLTWITPLARLRAPA